MPKPKLPGTIKVGPHVYRIVADQNRELEADDSAGRTSPAVGEIQIRSDHKSHTYIADTLLHEVLHAVIHNVSGAPSGEEEQFVERMSTGLLGVLRDNPDLIEFLTGE